jgi:type IV pilus assembly protein PilW
MMMMRRVTAPRGFTLIEVLIAATVSLVVITLAVAVGVRLQRRGQMEERTTETQNAARAARDLMAASIQRAGAGAGTVPLVVGDDGTGDVDLRYAVWPLTGAQATDAGPQGTYAALVSDGLEVWETDPGLMVPLKQCQGGGGTPRPWANNQLCTAVQPRPELVGRLAAVVGLDLPVRTAACLGQLGAVGNQGGTPSIDWTPGLPGRPTPASHFCGSFPASTAGTVWQSNDLYLMPVTARAYRVRWQGSAPTLEMDPDGFAGPQDFTPVSRDIERLQVRMGVMPSDDPSTGVLYFPDPAANRPALSQCTHTTCSPFVTWDAGTLAGDDGPGSARDELMRRVRLVELIITARSQRVDVPEQGAPLGGTDEDGNINDGFKRRHSVIRVAPRNFGYTGL